MIADRVRIELERMAGILRQNGFRLELDPPASAQEIASAEFETGIRFDEGLRSLFSLNNGSRGRTCLAIQSDELTPCSLSSIQEDLSWWREWLPYDSRIQGMFGAGEPGRDPRIRPDYFVHRAWFPLAEFNYWSTAVYFDADPTPEGTYGQIIAYQHDPDAVYFIAQDIGEFLQLSNERLAENANDLLFVDGFPSVSAPARLLGSALRGGSEDLR
jgi:cell wall assembly regulator SMI1